MEPDGESRLGQLESLVASKEREWKDLQTAHIRHLESCLAKSKEECAALRREQQKLGEDFQYNLQLLDERDEELQRYDVITSRAVALEHNRQEEVERLRRQLEKLQEEKQLQRLQQETLRRSMAHEAERQKQESDRMQRDWQSRILALEGELARQKKEMAAAFEKQLRLQKHGFDLQLDQKCAMLIGTDVKMSRLCEEKEAHHQAQLEATQLCEQLRSQLQLQDGRIQELKATIQELEAKLKKKKDENTKKCEGAARALREREAALEAERRAHAEQLRGARDKMTALQEEVRALAANRRAQEALQDKEADIHRLKQQLSASVKREKAWERRREQLELDWEQRWQHADAQLQRAQQQLAHATRQAEAELRAKEGEIEELTNMVQDLKRQRDQAAQIPAVNVERLQRTLSDVKGLCHQIHYSQAELHANADAKDNAAKAAKATKATADKQTCTEADCAVSAGYARALEQELSALKADRRELEWRLESAARRPPAADKQTCTEPVPDLLTSGLAGYARALEQELMLLKAHCVQLERRHKERSAAPGTAAPAPAPSAAAAHAPCWASKERLRAALREALCRIISMSRERELLLELSNSRNAKIRSLEAAACGTPGPEADEPAARPAAVPSVPTADKQTCTEPAAAAATLGLRALTAASSPQEPRHPPPPPPPPPREQQGAASPPLRLQEAPQSRPSESCENLKTPTPPRTPPPPPPPPPHAWSEPPHSGDALQSLKNLWRTLDHGLYITSQSEGEGELSRREAMTVYGVTAPIHSQQAAAAAAGGGAHRSEPTRTTKTSRPGPPARTSRVRNYNIKD